MNKKEYESYLVGEHWKAFKVKFYKVNKRECTQCKSIVKLNLHHLTYERLGKERLSDVVCLCEVCHHELHKQLDKDKLKKHSNKRKNFRKVKQNTPKKQKKKQKNTPKKHRPNRNPKTSVTRQNVFLDSIPIISKTAQKK